MTALDPATVCADSNIDGGNPRFLDPATATLAGKEGSMAAWRHAFAESGVAAPRRVHGDFAVGLNLPDGDAFIAVDRFAVRSLCHRVEGGRLLFADDARKLAPSPGALDPQALFDYLYFHVIPSSRTIYRDVRRLPPAHSAVFQEGKLTIAPYWRATFEASRAASVDRLKLEFRQHLRDAVTAQLDGHRVGCFLSGGTDSSTVAGMLTQVLGKPAPTFSIGFDADGYDEMEYSRIAAKHFGADHHEYYVTPADLVRSIPAVAASFDQPFGNSSVLPTYYCARLAKDAGIERMLGGDGGDELFGGNTRYAKQRIFGAYDHLPAALRKRLLEPLLAGDSWATRVPLLRKVASYVNQARVPMPDRIQSYNLLDRLGLKEVLAPGFLARVDPDAPRRHQREVWNASETPSLVDHMLAFDWRYTLAEADLPKVFGATRLAGIAVGFPLLDDRLVDFSMRLPAAYKVRGLKLRWFFKEALRDFLPAQIITKKKQGFGLPFGVWATHDAALMRLAADSLRSLGTRGIVRTQFIDAVLKLHLPVHPGYFGELVWILMMLEQWLLAHAPKYRADD